MAQYTHHCKNGMVIVKPVQTTHISKPAFCARCGIRHNITDTDGWDEYALRLDTSRQFTMLMLVKFDRALANIEKISIKSHTQDATVNCPTQSPKYRKAIYTDPHKTVTTISGKVKPVTYNLDELPNMELAELSFQRITDAMPNISHGICQINAHCRECGSSFEFSVSDSDHPITQRKPLTFCPYCATPTLVITPATLNYTERTTQQWSQLADLYLEPAHTDQPAEQLVRIADIQAKYSFWQSHSTIKTFAEFMAQLPTMLANSLNPTQPTKQIISNNRPVPTARKATKRLRIVIKSQTQPVANSSMPAYTMQYPKCLLCGCEQPSKTLRPFCEPCQSIVSKRESLLKLDVTKGGC